MHINNIGYVQDKNIKGRKLSDNQIGTKVSAKKRIGIQIRRYTCIYKYIHVRFCMRSSMDPTLNLVIDATYTRMSVLAVHEQLQLALDDFLQAAGVVLAHGTPEQVWQIHSCLCEVLSSGSGAYLYTFFLGWNVFCLNL